MTKSKKITVFLFSLMLVLAGLLFVACGSQSYKNVTLTSDKQVISLFVSKNISDEETVVENAEYVKFTINNPVNNMYKNLTYSLSNPGVCQVSLYSQQDNSTTYKIVGLKGGNTTLEAKTIEGNKTCKVTINVRQYSDKLTANSNSLYLSESSPLIPNSSDFVFDDNATERELNFYFYGKTASGYIMTEEDIKSNGEFVNKFVSANLISLENQYYIIFKDENDNLYTLSKEKSIQVEDNLYNTYYDFIEVSYDNDTYVFDKENSSSVSLGDKFKFLATYNISEEEIIICEREFSILIDIDFESLVHEYGYMVEGEIFDISSNQSYKLENLKNGNITLIPSYSLFIEDDPILVGKKALFSTVYLKITINTTSDLIKESFYLLNDEIANCNKLGKIIEDGKTSYFYEINCSTNKNLTTSFNAKFYYEGFENSDDSNVNFTYKIPVEIKVVPNTVLVNNVNLNTYEKTFTFYNNYAGNNYGWQEFVFNVLPTSADYTNLTVDLTGSNLQLKYNNEIYQDEIFTISQINYPIYLKGIDGAEITQEGQTLSLVFILNYNVLREEQYTVKFNYVISQGAKTLQYNTEDFANGIYLDINDDYLDFIDIYADAKFNSFSINYSSGEDIAIFEIDNENPYKTIEGQDGKYFLNFKIKAINLSSEGVKGTYTITLDNGQRIPLIISVIEELNNVHVGTNNVNDNVEYEEYSFDGSLESEVKYYVYNDGTRNYVDINIISNDNVNSIAIDRVLFDDFVSENVTIGDAQNSNKKFNIYLISNGSTDIRIRVYGNEINNFSLEEHVLEYNLHIVVFNYIEKLNIYKEKDGFGEYKNEESGIESERLYGVSASYLDVYSNTNKTDFLTAKLNYSLQNKNAYLFTNPLYLEDTNQSYEEASFSQNYLYWTVADATIQKNGVTVNYMYRRNNDENIYVINNLGSFNTDTLEFTAFQNIVTSKTFTLTAHVRQYSKTYSYTINVRITPYKNVEDITLTTGVSTLEFSSLKTTHSVVAYATNNDATNNKIVAIVNDAKIVVDGVTYNLIDQNSISYIESDGKYQITLNADNEFIKYAEGVETKIEGTLQIVAEDWLDSAGNIMSDYLERVKTIVLTYANGTEQNRFTLETVEDVRAIANNLSAHYQLRTTIDVSSISSILPLGEFKGSIIGLSQYAKLTGINIIKNNNEQKTYGLFSSLAEGSYIEYVSFEGRFQIGNESDLSSYATYGSKIGLIAGENYGKLININVTINNSTININQGYIGGVVGINYGEIIHDLTLYEDNTSQTRTSFLEELNNNGRISYAGFSPNITLYMNDYLNVNYNIGNLDTSTIYTYVGGITGLNGYYEKDGKSNYGSIKKVDSNTLNLTGYSNYTAYTLIKTKQIINANSIERNVLKIGGLAGEIILPNTQGVSIDSSITGGYNEKSDYGVNYVKYTDYIRNVDDTQLGDFKAGYGLVIGGRIEGYGYVGGVVGYISNLTNDTKNAFVGITSRIFVKGCANSVTTADGKSYTKTALIANISQIGVGTTISSAYGIQAVDEIGVGADASMIVVENSEKINDYYSNKTLDINKIVFGPSLSDNIPTVMCLDNSNGYINVYTYLLSRKQEVMNSAEGETSNINISSGNKSIYYGDFIVASDNCTVLQDQLFFAKGNEDDMSVGANFNNQMTDGSDNPSKTIFYMFYFERAEGEDISQENDAQTLLDNYVNTISASSVLYPILINGEITLTSKNTDILTIDKQGVITVKSTGLAKIEGSSILNRNNAIEFYIYVTNFFNPDEPKFTGSDSSQTKISIIYPSGSTSSTPIDDTIINLRGNNSVSLVVKPHYTLQINNLNGSNFVVSSEGYVSYMNKTFYIKNNENVSATILEAIRYEGENGEVEINGLENNELEVSSSGQIISIRKGTNVEQATYSLTLQPRLEISFEENGKTTTYYSNVNKTINNTTLDYKKGALSINHLKYAEVVLYSSSEIYDIIEISSDTIENEPYYYITDSNGKILQASGELRDILGQNFIIDSVENSANLLFNVDFKVYYQNSNDLTEKQSYSLTISINKNSNQYKNRYEQDIYGKYMIYIVASSNTEKTTSIVINFERRDINSVIIDNYTELDDAISSTGIGSISEYAYPGENGFIAITINPDDADFDYILIGNNQQNYQAGNSDANFGILARKANSQGEANIFEEDIILGESSNYGLKIYLKDIIDLYGNEKYISYNGVIYIKYNFSSNNVNNLSKSYIDVTLYKDNSPIYNTVSKEVTIKLQNYVAVELVDKQPEIVNDKNYYASYRVARGLKYELAISSYGFSSENINLVLSNDNLASIIKENGKYYLQITNQNIDYTLNQNTFDITVTAIQTDGDNTRTASSITHIEILEFVFNYSYDSSKNEDLVSGMGNGIINIQVGTQMTLSIDMFDYIEYNSSSPDVINKINNFFATLASQGEWKAHTNLITDTLPDYNKAEENKEGRIQYLLSNNAILETYYFNSNGLNITPIKTHNSNDKFYFFTFTSYYKVENGLYVVKQSDDNTGYMPIKTTFVLNVYTSSSEDSPLPIYDYNDFINMQQGQYYILLNDIVLPNEIDESTGVSQFTPLVGNFASLDGNGHSLILQGKYNMGSQSSIGIFSSLESGSQIKNLNVKFAAASDGSDLNIDNENDGYQLYGLKTVKFVTTSSSFNFAGLVVNNSGIITNCHIETERTNNSEYYIAIIADNASTGSIIAGLVANNTGYITNCSVKANIKSPFRIAGVVGYNSGNIAACYFKESKIINISNQKQYASGFVYTNDKEGKIITSYVAGKTYSTSLYSLDKNSYISCNEQGAGFVYENLGYISDCYTDIYLAVTPNMAGFVYSNGGDIYNSFSLSILSNQNSAAAGFAFETTLRVEEGNQTGGNTLVYTGEFSNCYYFYNEEIESMASQTGYNEDGFLYNTEDINTSLQEKDFEGISKYNAGQFDKVSEYFAEYAYSSTIGVNAIWFYSSGNTSSTYVDYNPTTQTTEIPGEDGKTQVNTVYETSLKELPKGRLELVSANIETLSIKNFSHTEVDESNGISQYIYVYIDDPDAPNRGSIHNPRLIYDANSMESEILEQTQSTGINSTNYRIISDIDYSETTQSKLYKTIFAGMIEGNGMTISSIRLYSEESLDNAGLFAQIGYSSSKTGAIKNLTINPSEVAFSSSSTVGTLAGTLQNGYLYDIEINSNTNSNSVVVVGSNIVGGVVGKAVSSYIMKDIKSDINATANYISESTRVYNENSQNDRLYSYAGSIVGYLGGSGQIYNAQVSNVTSVMGGRVGLLYGGVGASAKAYYNYADLSYTTSTSLSLKPYFFGGFIAGDISGTVQYSYVYGNDNTISPFSTVPKVPIAVGGICGILSGGTINNAVVSQSFSVTSNSSSSNINYVGGIAGEIGLANGKVSYINECLVDKNIAASSILGGAVAMVESTVVIDSVAIKSYKLEINGEKSGPELGGLVANSLSDYVIRISNSYCTSNLIIDTNTSGAASSAYVSGLVARPKTSNLYMSYCYTTSIIDVKLQDMRSTSSDYLTYDQYGEDNSKVSLFYNLINDSSRINEVYNLGVGSSQIGSGAKVSSEDYLIKNYNSYMNYSTRAYQSGLTLNVYNYGNSSYDYAGETNIAMASNPAIFYNLFNNNYSSVEGDFKYDYLKDEFIKGEDIYKFNANTGTYERTITEGDITAQTSTTAIIRCYEILIGEITKKAYYYNDNLITTNDWYSSYKIKNGIISFEDSIENSNNATIKSLTEILLLNEGFAPMETYKDLQGNVYIRQYEEIGDKFVITYTNIRTNSVYTKNSSGEWVSGSNKLSEGPSIKIWKVSINALSSLNFEDNLFWIKKI